MHTDPSPHLFWITSRAAGTVALLTASMAVGLGLLMVLRSRGTLLRGRSLDLRVTHEVLSLATLVAIVVHAAALLGDGFLRPSVLDISVPFVSGYQSLWTTAGIVAGWMLIVLGLSYYARHRIGQARWRRMHRFTALAWILGVAHTLGEGTDAGQVWFLVMVGIVVAPALALLVTRHAPALGGTEGARGVSAR